MDERLAAWLSSSSVPMPGATVIGRIAESGAPDYTLDIERDARWREQPLTRDTGFHGHAGIPLMAGDAPVGVLSLFFGAPRALSAEEQELLGLLASDAAVVIENDRLSAEAERRQRELEGLEGISRLLLQSLDAPEVGQRIVDGVCVLLNAARATLVHVQPDSEALRVVAISGEEAFPLGTGLARLAMNERAPLIIPDLLDDPRITLSPETRAYLRQVPVRAVLSAPLFVGERVIGALTVGDQYGRVFERHEVRLLQAFADRAAIAIHNARLYDETRHQRQEAVALEEVAREITSSLEGAEVFQRIVHRARELCRSDLAFLAPYDAKAGVATIVAASGVGHAALSTLSVRPGQGAGGRALETGEPFATDDYVQDPRIARERGELPAQIGVHALAVVPLRFRDSITGLLWVANRATRGFTARDLRVLSKLADQAAIALENSRLYAEAQELAVSRERVRVATGLHDTLSQTLFSVALGLDWCLHRLSLPVAPHGQVELCRGDQGPGTRPRDRRAMGPAPPGAGRGDRVAAAGADRTRTRSAVSVPEDGTAGADHARAARRCRGHPGAEQTEQGTADPVRQPAQSKRGAGGRLHAGDGRVAHAMRRRPDLREWRHA